MTMDLTVSPVESTGAQPPRVQRDLAQLKKASGQIIGSMFFGTLLKSMRESTLKGAYGHGGRGEEVFSAQLHGIYAERVGESMQNGINRAIYERLQRQQALISAQRKLG
jgi:hypothetical protein